jgi:hypothetical protein
LAAQQPGRQTSPIARETASIADFGDTSSFSTWRAAVAWMNTGSPKTLVIPRGVHAILRAMDDDPLQGILVFRNNPDILFQGGSELQFDDLRTPLLVFLNCTSGGIRGAPRLRFTGKVPSRDKVRLPSTLRASGFEPGYAFGGVYETMDVILSNSSNMHFDNLDVRAANPSVTSAIPFVINLKPATPSSRATGNRITNLTIRGFQHGVLFYGQDGLRIEGVDADQRTGLRIIAPGHVIYATGPDIPSVRSRNVLVTKIKDGSHPVDWPASRSNNLGTLAIKGISDSRIEKIRSYHPAGLITSIADNENNTFQDMCWRTDDRTPIVGASIYIISGARRNTYRRIVMLSPHKYAGIVSTSTGDSSDSYFEDVFIGSGEPKQGQRPTPLVYLYGSRVRSDRIALRASGGSSAALARFQVFPKTQDLRRLESASRWQPVKQVGGAPGALRAFGRLFAAACSWQD